MIRKIRTSVRTAIDAKKVEYRFHDGAEEPCSMLAPIEGFKKKPLVTLIQSMEPLLNIIPDIQTKVSEALKRAEKHVDRLSIDESAAIILYTMEWEPYTDSLFYILNQTLRTEDRSCLKPWFLYLKLILTALSRLPTISTTVYRGNILHNQDKYRQENNLVWWGFSSCSINKKTAENKRFMGDKSGRTLFIIDCIKGIYISKHSYFRKEKEVLLVPATNFQVIQCTDQPDGLCVIHLKEIQSPHQLLESVSTKSEIQTLKTISISSNTQSSVAIPNLYVNPKPTRDMTRFEERPYTCSCRECFTDNDVERIVRKQCQAFALRRNEITRQDVRFLLSH